MNDRRIITDKKKLLRWKLCAILHDYDYLKTIGDDCKKCFAEAIDEKNARFFTEVDKFMYYKIIIDPKNLLKQDWAMDDDMHFLKSLLAISNSPDKRFSQFTILYDELFAPMNEFQKADYYQNGWWSKVKYNIRNNLSEKIDGLKYELTSSSQINFLSALGKLWTILIQDHFYKHEDENSISQANQLSNGITNHHDKEIASERKDQPQAKDYRASEDDQPQPSQRLIDICSGKEDRARIFMNRVIEILRDERSRNKATKIVIEVQALQELRIIKRDREGSRNPDAHRNLYDEIIEIDKSIHPEHDHPIFLPNGYNRAFKPANKEKRKKKIHESKEFYLK